MASTMAGSFASHQHLLTEYSLFLDMNMLLTACTVYARRHGAVVQVCKVSGLANPADALGRPATTHKPNRNKTKQLETWR